MRTRSFPSTILWSQEAVSKWIISLLDCCFALLEESIDFILSQCGADEFWLEDVYFGTHILIVVRRSI